MENTNNAPTNLVSFVCALCAEKDGRKVFATIEDWTYGGPEEASGNYRAAFKYAVRALENWLYNDAPAAFLSNLRAADNAARAWEEENMS